MKLRNIQVLEHQFQKEHLVDFNYWKVYESVTEAYGYILEKTTAPSQKPVTHIIISVQMFPFMNQRIKRGVMYTNLEVMMRQLFGVKEVTYLRGIPDYCIYLVINKGTKGILHVGELP
jgi:hypothetical protein